MKTIASYIGYVMAVWGVVITIWTLATKNADKKYDVIDMKEEIIELKGETATIQMKIDTAIIHYTKVERTQTAQNYLMEELLDNQNVLKSSFVKHLKMDERYEELVNYLQNYEFDLKKAMSDSVKFNMLIRKIKK